MAEKYLFCVAHRHGDQWEAICLDLDLAVQGTTFAEVQEQLNAAISSYVEDAAKEPEPTRSQLLGRRAPLSARIAWLWPVVVSAVFDRRDGKNASVQFPVACHA
jgi:hypothetical protein